MFRNNPQSYQEIRYTRHLGEVGLWVSRPSNWESLDIYSEGQRVPMVGDKMFLYANNYHLARVNVNAIR
jgi:hypothetical protein